MDLLKHKEYLLVTLVALLCGFVYKEMYLVLLFFCWSPFLFLIFKATPYKSFKIGFLFGFFYGLSLFWWSISTINNYADSTFLGIIIFLSLALTYAVLYSVFALVIHIVFSKIKNNGYAILNILSITIIIVFFDKMLSYLFVGVPFLNLRMGYIVAVSNSLLQWSQFLGLPYLTFIVALPNVFISYFIWSKKRKYVIIPLFFLAISMSIGYVVSLNENKKEGDSIGISVLSGNIDPQVAWSSSNGNILANNYFNLCKKEAENKPDIVLFPESTIPWLYEEDDDLIGQIEKINPNAIHVIGANIASSIAENKIYNSAIFTSENNEINNTYYKNISLEAFEKPVFNFFQIPFDKQKNLYYSKKGNLKPITTKFGKSGVLICNELAEFDLIKTQVKNGADFFLVLNNDSWFKDTYISDIHFYLARIGAVMFHRSFAVSSNGGINGIIGFNGELRSKVQAKQPVSTYKKIRQSNTNTFFSSYPFLFSVLTSTILLITLLLTIKFYQNV